MNKTLRIAVIIFVISLSACSSWSGYNNEVQFKAVNNLVDHYELGIQNLLDPVRENSSTQAFSDIQHIIMGDAISSELTGKSLIASCDTGKVVEVSGDDVDRDLKQLKIRVSLFPKKPWCAIGLADHVMNRIAVDPRRIDGFTSADNEEASLLINTIAHEFTHMIIVDQKIKYRDRGHNSSTCPQSKLVSYEVGRAVQEIWSREYSD